MASAELILTATWSSHWQPPLVVMLSVLLQGPLLTAYVRRAFGKQQTLPEALDASPDAQTGDSP